MNVLITGGAGYIGIELAYRLAACNVIGVVSIYDSFSRSSYGVFCGLRKFRGKVRLVEDDILNNRALTREVKKHDVIVHLAASTNKRDAASAHQFEQINNWGTALVADSVREADSQKRVIYLSSLAVYGPGEVQARDQEPRPDSYYAISKLRGERHISSLPDNASALIVRSPSVFGYSKNLHVESGFNRIVFDAVLRGRVLLHGDDEANNPHVFIDDLVQYLEQEVLDYSNVGIDIAPFFNCSGMQVYEELKTKVRELEVIFVDQNHYATSQQVTAADLASSKLANTELSEGLRLFIEKFTVGKEEIIK